MSAPEHSEEPSTGALAARVRPIREADAEAYIALLERIDSESTYLLWEPGERTITAEELRSHWQHTDRTQVLHLVAEDRGHLVGFLVGHRGAVRRLRHRADFTMAVLQGHRRQGIGRRLLDALEAWAIDNDISRLELTVMSHNRAAIALYEQAGFVAEGVKVGAIRVDGVAIDECMMGKPLGA